MKHEPLNIKLNHNQLEILKLFSRDLDEKDLIEIKRLIVKYLANKLTEATDKLWDDKQWDDKQMEQILSSHKRTQYNPEN